MIPGDDNTIGAALRTAARRLEAVSGVPRIDSTALLGNVAGLTRAQILARQRDTLDGSLRDRFEQAIRRREAGEPLAYITGRREFWSLGLTVTPAALVPRAETELLVDVALRRLETDSARVLDLGTGSGAIAIALAKSRPTLDVTAVDVDPAALALACRNGADLGAAIRCLESDWTAALGDRVFDLVVSNPPYVRSDDPHFDGPLRFEPRLALDGGPDGLDACRRILASLPRHLAPGAQVLLEHGYDQREPLAAIAREAGYLVAETVDDAAGLPRVMVLRRRPA